jgi:hypothetical protein
MSAAESSNTSFLRFLLLAGCDDAPDSRATIDDYLRSRAEAPRPRPVVSERRDPLELLAELDALLAGRDPTLGL